MIKLSVIIPVYNQEQLVIEALDSIPDRKDIEVIVIDDCSFDDTFAVLRKYQSKKDFVLLYNLENKGVGYTVNKGIDAALGEYIVLLGSDDYFYKNKLIEAMDELDGTDMIYFNLQVNDGTIFELNEETKNRFCGSTKFIRRKFIDTTRNQEIRACEDRYFYDELQKKNPTEKFTGIVLKHYNYPRENSLSWNVRHGITDKHGEVK